MIVLHPGDQLWEYIAGGAGYGDPLERDPDRVLADALDRAISVKAARAEYGVVLSPDGTAVDEVKTKEYVDHIGQGEARGLQPPGADAGETIGELVIAGSRHDHFERREPGLVAPAELRSSHVGQQGDEITLGRARVLRRQSPDDMGRRDRGLRK